MHECTSLGIKSIVDFHNKGSVFKKLNFLPAEKVQRGTGKKNTQKTTLCGKKKLIRKFNLQ